MPLVATGIIEVNEELVSDKDMKDKLTQGKYKVVLATESLAAGAGDSVRGGGKTVREILKKTPLFKFRGVYRSDKEWSEPR